MGTWERGEVAQSFAVGGHGERGGERSEAWLLMGERGGEKITINLLGDIVRSSERL